MEIGVSTMLREDGISAVDLARALEERGLAALFVGEHSHIPVHPAEPIPVERGRRMARLPDPFVVLAAAAAVTERLRLGTSVLLMAQRDPIQTAKSVATLDQVSRGRVIVGVGIGWQREEMRNHGTDPRKRVSVTRERVLAMKEIWTRDEAEFHGRHVDFEPLYSWPKPVQRPHPPIMIGGAAGQALFERVLEYGDGWIPMWEPDVRRLGADVHRLRELAEARSRGRLPVHVTAVPAREEAVDGLRELGVDLAMLDLPPGTPDEGLRRLDQYARLLRP